MEPSDIDKIIKEKLSGNKDLHKHEMDAAKPFIWSAVQNEVNQKRSLRWYHLAAAIVLIMITFSMVIFSLQRSHEREINQLYGKMDHLEKEYSQQLELLQTKNSRIDSLGNELKNVALKFDNQKFSGPMVGNSNNVIYRVDTVYVKQYDYITSIEIPEEQRIPDLDSVREKSIFVDASEEEIMKKNYAIYSEEFGQRDVEKSETFKLKFGAFSTRNN